MRSRLYENYNRKLYFYENIFSVSRIYQQYIEMVDILIYQNNQYIIRPNTEKYTLRRINNSSINIKDGSMYNGISEETNKIIDNEVVNIEIEKRVYSGKNQ